MIADMINDHDQNYWKFQFTRVLQPWEEDQLQTLSQLLSVVQLQDDSEDCLQWKWRAAKSVLVRRGVIPGDLVTCLFCNSEEESPSHLLLHCHFSWEIWSEIIIWWKLVWICSQSLMQVFQFCSNVKFRNQEKLC
ncbi:hypothetical protein RHGRI_031010 [Rhododendron griersonianum]|uniref:Reverse transcriptase zinc-binding domain-containing protein n=1 Tax=Rhododendron griersonianum TaxID=479676 RepID=A0AAV6I8N6_9ERIC|nr:hypothetical protein RHGRI_031010 [Rhododendron griersonianum]